MFVPQCAPGGAFQPVQCGRGRCWCVDPQGRELLGSSTTGRLFRCPSHCEVQRANALKVKAQLAAGAEVHIPACSAAGDFLPMQCVASRCFCVDSEGRTTLAALAGGPLSCKSQTLISDFVEGVQAEGWSQSCTLCLFWVSGPGGETSPPAGGQRITDPGSRSNPKLL